jgi:hypothetical protein
MKMMNSINPSDQRLELMPRRRSGPIRLSLLLGLMTVFSSSVLAQGSSICLYEGPYYRGRSVCFSPGQQVSELQAVREGWNDRAQSIRVIGNVGATIYEHAGFTGVSFYVDSDIPDLNQIGRRRGGLAGEISSITVERRQVGRRSDYDEAYRLGQRDAVRGFTPNYRQYTSRYDRLSEAEFRRGYNEGYRAARSGSINDGRFPRTFRDPNLR